MKGTSGTRTAKSHTAYSGGNSKVASEMMQGDDGFKKGGKAVMSEAAGRKARKSGGGVLSSAAGGTPRGKASHY
jgi:hypothetical protein